MLPRPQFDRDRLVALEDADGFVCALAIVRAVDAAACAVTLRTPLAALEAVDAIRVGDLGIDPDTFRERRIPRP